MTKDTFSDFLADCLIDRKNSIRRCWKYESQFLIEIKRYSYKFVGLGSAINKSVETASCSINIIYKFWFWVRCELFIYIRAIKESAIKLPKVAFVFNLSQKVFVINSYCKFIFSVHHKNHSLIMLFAYA